MCFWLSYVLFLSHAWKKVVFSDNKTTQNVQQNFSERYTCKQIITTNQSHIFKENMSAFHINAAYSFVCTSDQNKALLQ